jgi:hypothetical protein
MLQMSKAVMEISGKPLLSGEAIAHDLWLALRTVWQQLDKVVEYEAGRLRNEETIVLFQSLIDSGLAWSISTCYAHKAAELIDLGACHRVIRETPHDALVL